MRKWHQGTLPEEASGWAVSAQLMDVTRPLQSGASTSRAVSFDHLIGALLKMQWHIESERFGGPEVEHQLELRRLYDRQVARFGALENSASVDTRLAIRIRQAGAVANQAAGSHVFAPDIGRRYAMLRSQSDDPVAVAVE